MKKLIMLIVITTLTLTLAAQSYSPCYTNNMSKGNTAFSQGKYSEAKTYYATAKQCAGGNPAEAQKKIAACDAKLKAQKETAEAQKRAETEAAKMQMERLCPSSVQDYDGNVYKTVYIGSQCWMAENLRTTHYANGKNIIESKESSPTVAYRYAANRNNSDVYAGKYGFLYNWAAVMKGASSSWLSPSGVRGVCPDGWHVPSDPEWTQLTDYVASQNKYICNDNSENIGKALASTSGWKYSSLSDCAVGNNQSLNNATGFSALPAGECVGDCCYYSFGEDAKFWSCSEGGGDHTTAYTRGIYHGYYGVQRSSSDKERAYSVRCVRD